MKRVFERKAPVGAADSLLFPRDGGKQTRRRADGSLLFLRALGVRKSVHARACAASLIGSREHSEFERNERNEQKKLTSTASDNATLS